MRAKRILDAVTDAAGAAAWRARKIAEYCLAEERHLLRGPAGLHICTGRAECVEVGWWGRAVRAVRLDCGHRSYRAWWLNEEDAQVIADPERYLREVALPRWESACSLAGAELPRPQPECVVHEVWVGLQVELCDGYCVIELRWLGRRYVVLRGPRGAVRVVVNNVQDIWEALGVRGRREAAALVMALERDGVGMGVAGVVITLAQEEIDRKGR